MSMTLSVLPLEIYDWKGLTKITALFNPFIEVLERKQHTLVLSHSTLHIYSSTYLNGE